MQTFLGIQRSLITMISVQETKKLLEDSEISDDKAVEIRDALYDLAELILDSFQTEKLKNARKYEYKYKRTED